MGVQRVMARRENNFAGLQFSCPLRANIVRNDGIPIRTDKKKYTYAAKHQFVLISVHNTKSYESHTQHPHSEPQ
jgi:hypothetical protein